MVCLQGLPKFRKSKHWYSWRRKIPVRANSFIGDVEELIMFYKDDRFGFEETTYLYLQIAKWTGTRRILQIFAKYRTLPTNFARRYNHESTNLRYDEYTLQEVFLHFMHTDTVHDITWKIVKTVSLPGCCISITCGFMVTKPSPTIFWWRQLFIILQSQNFQLRKIFCICADQIMNILLKLKY